MRVTDAQREEGRAQEDIDLAIATYEENRDTIRYNRSKYKPKEPQTRSEIVIDGLWSKTLAGDPFILQNDGIGMGHLIFSVQGNNRGFADLLCTRESRGFADLLCIAVTASQLGIEFKPNVILVDFESAMIEAIHEQLPATNVLGCLFHYSQCLFRAIQRLGLVEKYRVNEEFKRMFGRIKVSRGHLIFSVI